ncbi:MAG: hypothetical protein IID31_09635 [Planctomycetes bacterium]|nr:hypothetical protein [Planctomycetota bacterium]
MAYNHLDKLTPKQERAVAALLTEHSVERAAASAKVGTRTIYRWLDEPDFAAAYRRARRKAFGQAIALTQRYAPLAVNTLAKVMMDESAPHNAQVRAAATMLKFARDGIELDDLAARVEALEEAARGPARQQNGAAVARSDRLLR